MRAVGLILQLRQRQRLVVPIYHHLLLCLEGEVLHEGLLQRILIAWCPRVQRHLAIKGSYIGVHVPVLYLQGLQVCQRRLAINLEDLGEAVHHISPRGQRPQLRLGVLGFGTFH